MTRWQLDCLRRLMWRQDGVVTRRDILAAGGADNDIVTLLRRRELVAVHPGVYVTHSGRLTRNQRHWANVRRDWP